VDDLLKESKVNFKYSRVWSSEKHFAECGVCIVVAVVVGVTGLFAFFFGANDEHVDLLF
jgi:hypothetical protein